MEKKIYLVFNNNRRKTNSRFVYSFLRPYTMDPSSGERGELHIALIVQSHNITQIILCYEVNKIKTRLIFSDFSINCMLVC